MAPLSLGASSLVVLAGFGDSLGEMLATALALLEAGYQKAPVLVLVLSALLVLPAVALVSYLMQRSVRRKSAAEALRAARRRAEAGGGGDWTKDELSGTTLTAWPSQAWITVEGRRDGTVALAGQTIRIGRHKDNDICIPESSVHRYHAVIQRTQEDGFIITDVSGKEGNGIRINGALASQAQLVDGDVIELGRARLKFESAPA